MSTTEYGPETGQNVVASSKQETLKRVESLKGRTILAAILSFGLFAWLAAPQRSSALSPNGSSSSVTDNTGSGSDQSSNAQFPSDQVPNDQSGGFFDQGGNGYGFGNASGGPYARSQSS